MAANDLDVTVGFERALLGLRDGMAAAAALSGNRGGLKITA
jgi:hypothetical protein